MTRRVLSLAAYLLTCLALVGVAQTTPPRPYDAAREKRLECFRDVKYGMFIHRALYSIPRADLHGTRSPALAGWTMKRSHLPCTQDQSRSAQLTFLELHPTDLFP